MDSAEFSSLSPLTDGVVGGGGDLGTFSKDTPPVSLALWRASVTVLA